MKRANRQRCKGWERSQGWIIGPGIADIARGGNRGTGDNDRVSCDLCHGRAEAWNPLRVRGGGRAARMNQTRAVIEALAYVPNNAARVLTGGRTKIIGFVAPNIVDPFVASCADVLESVARAHDSLLMVPTTQNDVRKEIASVEGLLRHRVEGLIIAPAGPDSEQLLAFLKRTQTPIVALDRPISGSEIPYVVADKHMGARLATKHLIEHGYEPIVCLTGEDTLYTIRERLRGYRLPMKASGLTPSAMTSIANRASAGAAVEQLFASKKRPQALLTLKNKTTIDTYEALQERSISIPDSVALLGYDDFELAATLRPSVSVVQQPIEDLGRVAAELLFERLQGLGTSDQSVTDGRARKLQLKTRLIRRSSCGC